jgi:rubrerythrin
MTQMLTDIIPVEDLDADGALRETAGAVDGHTRGNFLRNAGVTGAGLLAGGGLIGALPDVAAAKLPKSDVAILNFALTLEYLEAAFYAEAVSRGHLRGRTRAFAELVADHEAIHVKTLKSVLGRRAVKRPKFDFKGTNHSPAKFRETAFVLENTGVHAYLGQAGNIKTPKILAAAASIVTVEARHAAAIAELLGHIKGKQGITPDGAFDAPLTKQQILRAVKGTGFIVG